MQHKFDVKVYPGDTDTYGVVWHGAYIKWLEAGRIEILEKMGIMFPDLDELGILMPVIELDIKYKRFTKAYDNLSIESSVEDFGKTEILFCQEIINKDNGQVVLNARVKSVTTNKNGKLYRVLPEYILSKLK